MTRRRITIVVAIFLTLITLNALAFTTIADVTKPREDNIRTEPYGGVVLVDGDTDLASSWVVSSGSGVEDDPYMIKGLGISIWNLWPITYGGNMTGIEIRNTTSHVVILDNWIEGLGCGVRLTNVSNCQIKRAGQGDVDFAFSLSNCTDCTIEAFQVYGCGVLAKLDNSTNVIIRDGRMDSGIIGVQLFRCQGVRIYHNDFMSFSSAGSDQEGTGNLWDNGYPSGGNFWDDYRGEDGHSGISQNKWFKDGIGDTPFESGEIVDRYPLMKEQFYEAMFERIHRASTMFPVALFANVILVPSLVVCLPPMKRAFRLLKPYDFLLGAAMVLTWPSLMDYAVQKTDTYEWFLLPQLQLALFACTSAYVAFLAVESPEPVKAKLMAYVAVGLLLSSIPIVLALWWAQRWGGVMRWGDQSTFYVSYVVAVLVGSSMLTWYLMTKRIHATANSPPRRLQIPGYAMLFIYALATLLLVVFAFRGAVSGEERVGPDEASFILMFCVVPANAGLVLFATLLTPKKQVASPSMIFRLLCSSLLVVFSFVSIYTALFPITGT